MSEDVLVGGVIQVRSEDAPEYVVGGIPLAFVAPPADDRQAMELEASLANIAAKLDRFDILTDHGAVIPCEHLRLAYAKLRQAIREAQR